MWYASLVHQRLKTWWIQGNSGFCYVVGPGSRNLFKFDLISLRLAHFHFVPAVVTIYTLCFVPPFQSGTSPLMSTLCSSSRTFQECVQSVCAVPASSSPTWLPLGPSAQFRRYSDLISHKCSIISPYSACCHSYRRLRSSVIGWF